MDYIKTKDEFSMFKYDGIQAMRYGKTDYAIECFNRALAIKDDSETRNYYANLLVQQEDYEGAAEELEKIKESEPDNLSNILFLADVYLLLGQYEKAGDCCNDALVKDDKLAMPHFILAKMYSEQNDLINTVAQATLAIAAKEDYYEAFLLRAKTLLIMQQFADAQKDIDIILNNTEENDECLLIKAQTCEGLGQLQEAENFYRKAIEYNPFAAEAYKRLGSMLMQQGKKKEAAEVAEEAMQCVPDEMNSINGEFTNWEQKMKDSYGAIDPFGLSK